MTRYLIVANQTLGGEQLTARIDQLVSAGSVTLHLAVPVTDTEGTHQWDYPPGDPRRGRGRAVDLILRQSLPAGQVIVPGPDPGRRLASAPT